MSQVVKKQDLLINLLKGTNIGWIVFTTEKRFGKNKWRRLIMGRISNTERKRCRKKSWIWWIIVFRIK